jgi:hypothetical protein
MTTHIASEPTRSAFKRTDIVDRTVLPGEPGWDAARQAWNLAVDQQPLAVVFPESTRDVATAVKVAASLGASVVAQGTGHGATAYSSLTNTVLIRTMRLQHVAVDPNARTGGVCRIASGALWGDVGAAAAPFGLAGLGGSSPDVGVVGYTLGGGIGWLSRPFGLACNAVRSIELVTASGDIEVVDARRHPDWFWAMRGGGGGIGVVTALEFELKSVPGVLGGTLAWPAEHGPALLAAWLEWTAQLDDSISSIIRFLHLPDIAGIPAPFRGRRMLTIGIAAIGDLDAAASQVHRMRQLVSPELDTVAPMGSAGLSRLHGDPETPTAGMSHHTLLGGLDEAALESFLEVAGADSQSALVSAEIRHLGGALATAPAGAGALSHIEAPYVLNAVGLAVDRESAHRTYEELGAVVDAMAPWSDGAYLNFVERPGQIAFSDQTAARLSAIKAAADPAGVFQTRVGTSGQPSVPAA